MQSQLGIRLETRVECHRLSVYIPESKERREREKPQLVGSSTPVQCLTSYPISTVTNHQTREGVGVGSAAGGAGVGGAGAAGGEVAQFGVEIISAQQTALCNYAKQFSNKQPMQHASNGAHTHTVTHTHSHTMTHAH